ncbi:MAG: M20/M25/M40 family metallo-hydrolase [Planctomycetes bacterium]|nr:M20/M25/M40 family metallo-hydrolase [Planctomycetota bacterium]
MNSRVSPAVAAVLAAGSLVGLYVLQSLRAAPRHPVDAPALRSAEAMAADVQALASPQMLGRAEETGGAALAAGWIEERLHALGLRVERQPFAIDRARVADRTSIHFEGVQILPGVDFAPLVHSPSGEIDGFLEPGLAARISHDEASMRGKVAVEHVPAAPGMFRTVEPPLVERALAFQDLGAIGVVFIADFHDPEAGGEATWPFNLGARVEAGLKDEPEEARSWLRDRRAVGARSHAPAPSRPLRIPAALVSSDAGRAVDQGRVHRVHLRIGIESRPLAGQNVLALLPGSHPERSAILLTAHYDSHGFQPPSAAFPGGRRYPGACDNASGVAVLLAVAEALSQGPPLPRPVVFAFFGGEELGLHGSRAFAASLSSLNRGVLCDLNVDMAARNDEKEITLVGTTFAPDLAALAKQSLESAGFHVNTNIDFTYRFGSDHWSLHQAGVPSILVTCSRFAERDMPGDTPELCSAAKMHRVAEAVLAAVQEAADRPGDFARPLDAVVKFPGEK